MLNRLDAIPPALLDCAAGALVEVLPGPTLFDLPGGAGEPIFLSVLLHGNEDTGFEAVKRVLARHGAALPRPLLLFIGNIEAAAAGVRTLPQQHDYNRVWPGTDTPYAPEARLMAEVVKAVAARRPFASLDIHNNSGLNPHYACVNRLDDRYFHLARLFSRVVVYFTRPRGVQSLALANVCPAVTVECGRIGEQSATGHAAEFIDACLHLHEWPAHPLPAHDLELLRTIYRICVPPEVSFSFDGTPADIVFRPDIDHLNFSELAPGTPLGRVCASARGVLEVQGEAGAAPDAELFDYSGGEIRLLRSCVPSMLTRDVAAVRLDCLGYLMQRIDRSGAVIG